MHQTTEQSLNSNIKQNHAKIVHKYSLVKIRTLTKIIPTEQNTVSLLTCNMGLKINILEISWGNNVINFQYHLDNLSSE